MTRLQVLLLASAVLMAGCASDPDPTEGGTTGTAPAGGPTPTPGAPPTGAPTPEGTLAALWGAVPSVDKTIWANGSFKVEQASRGHTNVPRLVDNPQQGRVEVDITSELPKGLPAVVTAEMQGDVGQGDLDLWIDVPNDEFRSGSGTAPYGGYTHLQWLLVPAGGGPITVVVFYDVVSEKSEAPYTLSIRIQHVADAVPGAGATGVTVPPGTASMGVELRGEADSPGYEAEQARLMVWGPDDKFLGGHVLDEQGVTQIPLDPAGGEHVVLLSQGARWARLLLPGTTPAALRPLAHEWTFGEERRSGGQPSVTWSFTLPKTPLLVGLFAVSAPAAKDITLALKGPGGELFNEVWTGGPWVSLAAGPVDFQTGFGMDTAYGTPGLAAGDHEATVGFAQAAGGDVVAMDFAIYHKR